MDEKSQKKFNESVAKAQKALDKTSVAAQKTFNKAVAAAQKALDAVKKK